MPKTANIPQTLDQRVKAINRWCFDRGINQQYTFFKGCDNDLLEHYNRIRAVLPGRAPVMDVDAEWVASMEATIAALANRKQAA